MHQLTPRLAKRNVPYTLSATHRDLALKSIGLKGQNIRMFYPNTWGCFNGKDADVITSQYTRQTGSVLMGEALSPYTSRVH